MFPPGNTTKNRFHRLLCRQNVAFFSTKIQPAKTPHGGDLQNINLSRFFRFVGGEGGEGGGDDFEDVEGLPREDHLAASGAVDQLGLVGVEVTDDLAGDDFGTEPIVFIHAEGFEDGSSGCAGFALVRRVNFEQTVKPFDHLDAGTDGGRFEGNVGNAINFDTGGDFNPQRAISGKRQEAKRHRPDVGCMLRLQPIEVNVAAEFDTHSVEKEGSV